MKDGEFASEISSKIEELIRYVAAAESVAGLLPLITLTAEQVTRIVQRDPELAPEMESVIGALEEAMAAATRCFEFASTRMSVRMDLGNDPPA